MKKSSRSLAKKSFKRGPRLACLIFGHRADSRGWCRPYDSIAVEVLRCERCGDGIDHRLANEAKRVTLVGGPRSGLELQVHVSTESFHVPAPGGTAVYKRCPDFVYAGTQPWDHHLGYPDDGPGAEDGPEFDGFEERARSAEGDTSIDGWSNRP